MPSSGLGIGIGLGLGIGAAGTSGVGGVPGPGPDPGDAEPLLDFDLARDEHLVYSSGSLVLSGSGQSLSRNPIYPNSAGTPASMWCYAWGLPSALPPGTTGEETATLAVHGQTSSAGGHVFGIDVTPTGAGRAFTGGASAAFSATSATGLVQAGSPALVAGAWDASANRSRVWVNGGNHAESTSSAVGASTYHLALIGARTLGTTTRARHFAGRIQAVAFGAGAFADADAAWLWNSGAGRTYAEVLARFGTSLIDYYKLDEPDTGNRRSHMIDGRVFTATGSPTHGGPVVPLAEPALGQDRVTRVVIGGRNFDAASSSPGLEYESSPLHLQPAATTAGLQASGATLLGRTQWEFRWAGIPRGGSTNTIYTETGSDGTKLDIGTSSIAQLVFRLTEPDTTVHEFTSTDTIYGMRPVTGLTSETVTLEDDSDRKQVVLTLGAAPDGVTPPAGQVHPFPHGAEVALIDCGITGNHLVERLTDTTITISVPTSNTPALGANPRVRLTGSVYSPLATFDEYSAPVAMRIVRNGESIAMWSNHAMIGSGTLSGLPAGPSEGVVTGLFAPADARATASTVSRLFGLQCLDAPASDDDWKAWATKNTIWFRTGRENVGRFAIHIDAIHCAAVADRRRPAHYEYLWTVRGADGELLDGVASLHSGQSYRRPEGHYVGQVVPDGAEGTIDLAIVSPALDAAGSPAAREVVARCSWPFRSRPVASEPGWRHLYLARSSAGGSDSNPGTEASPKETTAAAVALSGPRCTINYARGAPGNWGTIDFGAFRGPLWVRPFGTGNRPLLGGANAGAIRCSGNARDLVVEGFRCDGLTSGQPRHLDLTGITRRTLFADLDLDEAAGILNNNATPGQKFTSLYDLKFRRSAHSENYGIFASGFSDFLVHLIDYEASKDSGTSHIHRGNRYDRVHFSCNHFMNTTASNADFDFRGDQFRLNICDTNVGRPWGDTSNQTNIQIAGPVHSTTDQYDRLVANAHCQVTRCRNSASLTQYTTQAHGTLHRHNAAAAYQLNHHSADPRQLDTERWTLLANRRLGSGTWTVANAVASTFAPTTGAGANRAPGASPGALGTPGAPTVLAATSGGLILSAGLPTGGAGFHRGAWWHRPVGGGTKTYIDGAGGLLLFDPSPEAGTREYGYDVTDELDATAGGTALSVEVVTAPEAD